MLSVVVLHLLLLSEEELYIRERILVKSLGSQQLFIVLRGSICYFISIFVDI
jgi:hypothetical protein